MASLYCHEHAGPPGAVSVGLPMAAGTLGPLLPSYAQR
jgi:hypothetical protein